jgi:hypothetical protein
MFLYEFPVSLERATPFPTLTRHTSAIPVNNQRACSNVPELTQQIARGEDHEREPNEGGHKIEARHFRTRHAHWVDRDRQPELHSVAFAQRCREPATSESNS